MIRTLTTISALLFVLLASRGAYAQKAGFGEKGEFILGADRLVPVFSYSQVWQGHLGNAPPNETTTFSQTSFSFFWGSTAPEDTFFTVPRIGLDYVLAPHFTIGGELVLFVTAGASSSIATNTPAGTTTTPNQSTTRTTFGIAPRVGYVLELTNLFSLWLRGGFSFYTEGDSQTLGTNTGSGVNQFALDLEPQFVITPLAHVGITLGPTLDLPLFGQRWQDPNQSAYDAVLFFGINAGLLVYF
jgi:hypothetical protein